jgi:hypothetical protein
MTGPDHMFEMGRSKGRPDTFIYDQNTGGQATIKGSRAG